MTWASVPSQENALLRWTAAKSRQFSCKLTAHPETGGISRVWGRVLVKVCSMAALWNEPYDKMRVAYASQYHQSKTMERDTTPHVGEREGEMPFSRDWNIATADGVAPLRPTRSWWWVVRVKLGQSTLLKAPHRLQVNMRKSSLYRPYHVKWHRP